jgi:hypothetical protein
MRKLLWAALALASLAAGGLVYAKSRTATEAPYICPITGEELPCPCCCPLNQE